MMRKKIFVTTKTTQQQQFGGILPFFIIIISFSFFYIALVHAAFYINPSFHQQQFRHHHVVGDNNIRNTNKKRRQPISFLSLQQQQKSAGGGKKKKEFELEKQKKQSCNNNNNIKIFYSPNFNRHIVAVCEEEEEEEDSSDDNNESSPTTTTTKHRVLESFLWFDQAIKKYPNAKIIPFLNLNFSISSSSSSSNDDDDAKSSSESSSESSSANNNNNDDMMMILPRVAGGGLQEDSAYNNSSSNNNNKHSDSIICQPPNIIAASNINKKALDDYNSIISTPFGSSLLEYFPSLSDRQYIKERILFLLSPIYPPITTKNNNNASTKTTTTDDNDEEADWPKMFSTEGYGAGMTQSQVMTAIQNIDNLLFVDPVESNLRKLPMFVYYRQLQVPFGVMNEARVQLNNWLSGSSPSDVATFAFLHHALGVSWDQCRIILGAFHSSLTSCDLNMLMRELLDNSGNTPIIRKSLSEESIYYLRMRLQLTPTEVYSLIKSHSRLCTYTPRTIKSHLNELQSTVDLTSQQIQHIVYRNPSILGVSIDKLRSRINFLSNEVNLARPQIRSSVIKLPSLLQYSIENNLRPKVKYLTGDLGISQDDFTNMVIKNPPLLGVSLTRRIVSMVEGIKCDCGMSNEDVSQILVQVPHLLSLNWETNVKQKIQYLNRRLDFSSQSALRSMIISTPRILMHSVDRSLEPKIRKLEQASSSTKEARRAIVANPSLLLTSLSALNIRIESCVANNNTVKEYFKPRQSAESAKMTKTTTLSRRKRRNVMEFSGENCVRNFPDVTTAAEMIGTSRSNMYKIIQTGRDFKGKTYSYGTTVVAESGTQISSSTNKESKDNKQKTRTTPTERFCQDLRRNFVPDEARVRLVDALRRSSIKRPPNDEKVKKKNNNLYMQAFVSGRTFPPEKSNQARGREREGGLAMYMPQLRGPDVGGRILRTAAENCFSSQLMSTPENGTRFCDGLIVLGYVYTKPSRNRCGLYVCRDILRIVAQLLQLEASCPDLPNCVIDIDIFTDSNYAWRILKNNTSLLRLGAYPRKDDFVYDGELEEWNANYDILYPLSRTYYRVVNQELLPAAEGNNTKSYAKEVNVRFRHQSEISPSGFTGLNGLPLGAFAAQAAEWQYEIAQEVLMS